MLNFSSEKIYEKESSTLVSGEVNEYIQKFNINEGEEKFDKTLEFWKKERETLPTDNQNKCVSCEFQKKCTFYKT